MVTNLDMAFKDREEAANKLIESLSEYKGKNPLILAIPRGAVPMAKMIAEDLQGELDVVLVHKIGAPGNPEYAIGSTDERGNVHVNIDIPKIDPKYIEETAQAELKVLKKRRETYGKNPIDPKDRVVIIVDDGIATGSTMLAAVRSIKQYAPKKLIAAIGVAPPNAVDALEKEVDEVVCLETPVMFFAVGQFFENFPQVSDEEVISIIKD